MKIRFIAFVLISLVFTCKSVYADSPLTSTNISKAYQDLSIVIKASEAEGILTNELIEYLLNEKNPIANKIALINELGWDIDGKNNAAIFLDYLIQKQGYEDQEDFLNNGKDFELLSMAYLKALDDYFNVSKALIYAERALSKNSKSYTYNIITALIEAQIATRGDWCKVYKLTDQVRTKTSLETDMRDEAVTIIFDYMDSYKKYCN